MRISGFQAALPIWAKNITEEMNVHLKLATNIKADGADCLRIATHGFYQLKINGEFVSYGPARAGRGFFRIDEIIIKDKLYEENNYIEILLYSYGVESFTIIKQAPFVTCEIIKSDEIIAATGNKGFVLERLKNYSQSISKQSFQRGFVESYIIDDSIVSEKVKEKICEDKKYIEREVDYSDYEEMKLEKFISCGKFKIEIPNEYLKMQAEMKSPEECEQFLVPREDITKELQRIKYETLNEYNGDTIVLKKGDFAIGKFERECTGVIAFKCKCETDSVLYVTFDETLINNYVNPQRLNCNMVVKYRMKKGEYNFLTFEPVSLKYICFNNLEGNVTIENVHVIEIKHCAVLHKKDFKDPKVQKIYDASLETFRQNAIDIFMDCPSRERAGWLCDSFFMARAEHFFTGNSKIEKNFLENFLMEDNYENIPQGMIPMCYPANHSDGVYIPNWPMWLVLEIYEYYNRTSDIQMIKSYQEKLYRLYTFFEKYENEDGLLENLEQWVFVDWSESNVHTQDISFPSNMMYAYMLDTMSVLYHDAVLKNKAETIRNKIRELSYNGHFFCDNLLKHKDGYKPSNVCTESCQYYAFFTKTAIPDNYPELWNKLIYEFGPERVKNGLHLNIAPSNAFVGNFIRLELLSEYHMWEKLLDEIKLYFGYMAERTGTLWENIDDKVSMNHGFSSQVAVWTYECVKAIERESFDERSIF